MFICLQEIKTSCLQFPNFSSIMYSAALAVEGKSNVAGATELLWSKLSFMYPARDVRPVIPSIGFLKGITDSAKAQDIWLYLSDSRR